MEVIKRFFSNLSNQLSMSFHKFPLTSGSIFLFALTFSILMDSNGDESFFERFLGFMLLFGLSMFFVESCIKQRLLKYISIPLAALISAALTWMLTLKSGELWGLSFEELNFIGQRSSVSFGILMLVLGVWKTLQDSDLSIAEFSIKAVRNYARIMIICAVLSFGIFFVCAIFILLILDQKDMINALRINTFVLINFYGIGFLYALLSMEQELSKFFSFVVRYILLLPLIAAFIVIYGYILKIAITQIVPSNQVFRILAALFLCGLPIWTINGYFEEDSKLQKISTLLPYVFIPFIALQAWALGLRINANGLTPFRCIGVVLMILEVLYIALYYLKKGQTNLILPCFAIFISAALLFPGVNIFDLSVKSQRSILLQYNQDSFGELSPQDQGRVVGAYYYLLDDVQGKKTLDDISAPLRSAIVAVGPYGIREDGEIGYVSKFFTTEQLDISGFQQVSLVNYSQAKEEAYPQIEFDFAIDEPVQLQSPMDDFLAAYVHAFRQGSIDEMNDLPRQLSLTSGGFIYLSWIGFTLDDQDQISNLSFEGLLVE